MTRRMVILTEGFTEPHRAKTAANLVRYKPEDVVALFDKTQVGKRSGDLLGVGDVPVVGSLDDAPGANTLLLGIAPPGGKVPPPWRAIVLDAIGRGMEIVSGLHEFLCDDPEFSEAARRAGVRLVDVRKNDEREIAKRLGLRPDCYRLHTVGHDCTIGKMVVAVEVARRLQQLGRDAKFIATGQTGIMIEGDGCPVDRTISDFTSGAAERLVLEHQHHEMLVVEGQGSLSHPSYAAVTLGLLHGCLPHALLLCYEVGRTRVSGLEHCAIPPLAAIKQLNETMANLYQPCQVIGVAMNSRKVSAEAAEEERARVRAEFGLPVCDVFRHGPDDLVNAVLDHYNAGHWRETSWRA